MEVRIKFTNMKEFITSRDGLIFVFYYEIVDNEFIGKPEEKSHTKNYRIKVGISDSILSCWRSYGLVRGDDIQKVLFEYCKRHIIKKIKYRKINEYIELILPEETIPCPCEFDPKLISNPIGYSENIFIHSK